MEIRYDRNRYIKALVVKDCGASIEIYVEYRQLHKNDSGNLVCTMSDVDDEAMEKVAKCLEDMADDRVREFNSRDCIERLFEKLPEDVRDSLLADLVKRYGESAG